MRTRKPVWTEGLFVTQHHLQQQDRYHEQLLDDRVDAVLPYSFGLVALEIDERALEVGQFSLKRLAGVFPSGVVFSCGERTGDTPPARSVNDVFAPELPSLPVYIAVPQEADTGKILELDSSVAGTARFVAQSAHVRDETTGGQEQEYVWARANLKILLGSELREGYEAIQIADLVRSAHGSLMLRDTFVPSVFRIGSSTFLMSGLRRIVSSIVGRQRTLAASRRQRSQAAVDFSASDAAKFWLLDSLNQSIPELTHLVDQGTSHPEQAYLALGRVVGRLCTFAVDADPAQIPKFNYLNLGDTFEPLFARVLSLLQVVIAERYTQIPLNRREDGMYLGQVTEVSVLRQELFLTVSGSGPVAELRDTLPRLSKIASWQQIGPILNSAINGLRLDLEFNPPGALPLRPNMLVYRVQKTPEYWNDVQGTGTIAVYHPPTPGNVEFSLYAIDPQNL